MAIPSENYIRNNKINYKKSQNKNIRHFHSGNQVYPCKIYLSDKEYTILKVASNKLKLSHSAMIRYLINEFHREFISSEKPVKKDSGENFINGFNLIRDGYNKMFKPV